MFRFFKKITCAPYRIFGNRKRLNAYCKCTRQVQNVNNINYEELQKKAKEGALLIDVRTKQEYMEKHIYGAILIPYFEIDKRIQYIVPNKENDILLYCQNGGRSLKAFETLTKLGYKNVYNLKGGIEEI